MLDIISKPRFIIIIMFLQKECWRRRAIKINAILCFKLHLCMYWDGVVLWVEMVY